MAMLNSQMVFMLDISIANFLWTLIDISICYYTIVFLWLLYVTVFMGDMACDLDLGWSTNLIRRQIDATSWLVTYHHWWPQVWHQAAPKEAFTRATAHCYGDQSAHGDCSGPLKCPQQWFLKDHQWEFHMCDGQNSIHVVRSWHRFIRPPVATHSPSTLFTN